MNLVSPVFYEVGFFGITEHLKRRRIISGKFIYFIPEDSFNQTGELCGVIEGYVGGNGKLAGSITAIPPQRYFYVVSPDRVYDRLDKSLFFESVEILNETDQNVDLNIISSANALAAITSIEIKSVDTLTARGIFTITNAKERVVTNFVSGGIPVGKNVPPGDYDILQKNQKGFYRLESRDTNYGDDIIEGTDQGLIRLHHRGSGRTFGCISITDDNDWEKIDKIIQESVSTLVTVKQMRNYPVPFFGIFSFDKHATEALVKYGTLRVMNVDLMPDVASSIIVDRWLSLG